MFRSGLGTVVCAVLALGCTSCNLAPKYQRPPTTVPAAFKEAPAAADADGAAWKAANPRDDSVRSNWWEQYGDPDLNALEQQVRISNQTIRAAEANYRVSRALVVQARASLFPTLSASPAVTRSRSSQNYSSSGSGGGTGAVVNNFNAPLDASYTVDLWGRIRNTVSASEFSAQASAADLATAVLGTQVALAEDYFELRALDEQRRILTETVSSYRQTLDLTASLVRNGIDSDEDLAIAQSQYDTVVTQATDVGVSRTQVEHAIAVLIGKPPSDLSISATAFLPNVPANPQAIPSDLLERRPDIAAAERQVAAANAQIGVARTAYFPNLTLNGAAGYQSSNSSNWFAWPSRFWSVGPQIGATIFSVGSLRGVNDQAKAAYDQAVANYRQTVLAAFQAVEDNLAALRILAVEEKQERTAVASAEHYLALAQTRFKAGIDSSLNVAIAQNAVLTNRETWVQVQLREVNASIALVAALGGGWDASQLPKMKDIVARPPKWKPANSSDMPPPEPIAPANPQPVAKGS
jgi:NodT family efflux transporter outer membrane factor (OMF) lipoprotein